MARSLNSRRPIYDYRPKSKHGRYMIIALRIKMADGVLTSSSEQAVCKLFFGTQVLPKNRGACVDTWFWHDAKCSKGGLKRKACRFWVLAEDPNRGRKRPDKEAIRQGETLKFGPLPSDLISKAEIVFEVLGFCIQSTIRLITPSRWSHMRKLSAWIVFVSSNRSIFI